MPPFIGTVAAVHGFSEIVDEVVHRAVPEPSSGVVVAEVVTLVVRLKERVVWPGQLINFGEAGRQGALEYLRIRALGSHPALRTLRAN